MSGVSEDNTYFIDSDAEAELVRLTHQDRLLNKHIRLLPTEFLPEQDARIADLATGPGAWCLAVAEHHPQIFLTGIDINERMVAYAIAQAQLQQRDDRVCFRRGNILRPLDFADASLDLVNARLLQGVMLAHQWGPLVKECHRVLRPGGLIRMVEMSTICYADCPQLHMLNELSYLAFWRAGKTFSEKEYGLTPMLASFMRQGGFQVINMEAYVMDVSASSAFYSYWIQGQYPTLQLIKPFLLKHIPTLTVKELDTVCEASYQEMLSPAFKSHWYFTSVTGRKEEE